METKGNSKKRKNYGSGSIYQLKDREGFGGGITLVINGVKTRKTVYGKTKTEVRNKIKELQSMEQAGVFKEKNYLTIKQLAQKIIDEQLALNEIKQSSYDRKSETLKKLKPIYDIRLQDITEDQIKRFFITQINYSQSIINKEYQLLKAVMKEAERKKIITENPMSDIKKPKSKQELVKVRALTLGEQQKLLEVLKTQDVNYSEQMIISMFTGARMGEINALEVKDIDVKNKTISIHQTVSRGNYGQHIISKRTKTSAGMRKLPIDDTLADFLKECIGDKTEGLIFTRKGRIITTSQVNNQYSRILKKYNIIDETVEGKVDLHSLRHTYATRCIESGMPPKVLQKLLGHTDISVTLNTYCTAFDEYTGLNIEVANNYMTEQNLSIA